MNNCSNFISLCYPCSKKYHALNDFQSLQSKNKILVSAVTALVALLTLPLFGLLAVLTFRCLVQKLPKVVDLSKGDHENPKFPTEKVQKLAQNLLSKPDAIIEKLDIKPNLKMPQHAGNELQDNDPPTPLAPEVFNKARDGKKADPVKSKMSVKIKYRLDKYGHGWIERCNAEFDQEQICNELKRYLEPKASSVFGSSTQSLKYFKNFLRLLDNCNDQDLRWNVFDHVAKEVFNKDINSLDMMSKYFCLSLPEKRRLGVDKYEIPMNLFLDIKERKLHLPERSESMAELLKNLDKNQEALFSSVFLKSLCEENPQDTIQQRLNDLHYFISWLEKLKPVPNMLNHCIQKIYVSYVFSDENLLNLTKIFSYDVLKNWIVPCLIKNRPVVGIWHHCAKISQIITLLKPKDARALINKEWASIPKLPKFNIVFHEFYRKLILKNIDNSKKLEDLFIVLFADDVLYYSLFFDYMEKQPWNLLFFLSDNRYKDVEGIPREEFPICRKILDEYDPKIMTKEMLNQLSDQLLNFFTLAKNNQLREAVESYTKLPSEIKKYLLVMTRNSNMKIFCEELPYLNEAQLLVALLDEQSNQNICRWIEQGWREALLTKELLEPIVSLALEMQNTFAQEPEKSRLENLLNLPLALNPDLLILLRNGYKDPRFSDITFNFGDETVKAHRALLSLDPILKPYIPDNTNQIIDVDDSQKEIVKSALTQIYSIFHLKNLIIPGFSVKVLYDHSLAYSDFILSCGDKKMFVHRALLKDKLSHFQKILNFGGKEAQEGKMEIDSDHFEGPQVVVEFIYTGEMPEFQDEASQQAFNDALEYYNLR